MRVRLMDILRSSRLVLTLWLRCRILRLMVRWDVERFIRLLFRVRLLLSKVGVRGLGRLWSLRLSLVRLNVMVFLIVRLGILFALIRLLLMSLVMCLRVLMGFALLIRLLLVVMNAVVLLLL